MFARFDQNTLKCLLIIILTSVFPYSSIMILTFDIWPLKPIGPSSDYVKHMLSLIISTLSIMTFDLKYQ